MAATLEADICVIGAGSAGLVVAAGAAQMGATVVLIEKGRMGGDCLNFGCVPSKAMLAAGRMAAMGARAAAMGVAYAEPEIDFAAVQDHVAGVIAAIAPMDSVARFEGLGVRVLQEEARFVARNRVAAGGHEIRARRFVIATGSRPMVPPIPGMDSIEYLTNESLFANREAPSHLVVIGAGPIGLEMAQAHHNLGSRVTVFEMAEPLGTEDPETVALLIERLRADGIDIRARTRVTAVARGAHGIDVSFDSVGGPGSVTGSHLLVAAGRVPVTEGLGLAVAGVATAPGGIVVDARMRTSNPKIYAIGDVSGGPQFTHVAGFQAGIALRNILFRWPARANARAIPHVTYTDPELAHIGLTEAEARARGPVTILRWPFAENDRAQTERDLEGLVKVIAGRRGKVLGASILGAGAGDLIMPWVLAIAAGLKLGTLAGVIAPYPTRSEAGKRAAFLYYLPSLSSPRVKRLVRFLARFG